MGNGKVLKVANLSDSSYTFSPADFQQEPAVHVTTILREKKTMRRLITGEAGEPGFECLAIPDTAAITITNTCSDCDWRVDASSRNKPACNSPHILASRPYAQAAPGSDSPSRAVEYGKRPEWCPLDKKVI